MYAFFACACGDAKPPGGHNDAVCLAWATNSSDNLTNWTKYDGDRGSVIMYMREALGPAARHYEPIAGSQFVC